MGKLELWALVGWLGLFVLAYLAGRWRGTSKKWENLALGWKKVAQDDRKVRGRLMRPDEEGGRLAALADFSLGRQAQHTTYGREALARGARVPTCLDSSFRAELPHEDTEL